MVVDEHNAIIDKVGKIVHVAALLKIYLYEGKENSVNMV